MASPARVRQKKLLDAAEGFLELELPLHALDRLDRLERDAPLGGSGLNLRGQALVQLKQYAEALSALTAAAEAAPSHLSVWVSIGWCQKRLGRLDLAIEALHQGRFFHPAEPLLLYNLACYFSLSGQKDQCLNHLGQALALNARYLTLIPAESDFNPVRDDPEFQALTTQFA